MTNSPKLAWSIPSFAEDHGLAESTIWNEIRTDELESISVGDRRLITPEQRARWIERKALRARQRDAARKTRQLELRPGDDDPSQAA